ncbi:MAG: hypothetical protein ABUT20_52840, partial [Bacteroidota bacterium]
AITEHPIPGMIVNLKKMPLLENREVARLESTMQNIADCLIDQFDEALEDPHDAREMLKTFLTFNLRRKTISTTKRERCSEGILLETPEGCFYDFLHNAHDLLTNFCHFDIPSLCSSEEYLQKGPSFIFLYHPALGPLYSIISQKLKRGYLAPHSELQLEIAEIDCEDLQLTGSLKIIAQNIMGNISSDGLIQYGEKNGKCILKRVKVINQGIDTHAKQCYWKNEIIRKQLCEIIIHGNGEFIAEDVTLKGDIRIVVDDGFRVRALQENDEIIFTKEAITFPSWQWDYCLSETQIKLLKTKCIK